MRLGICDDGRPLTYDERTFDFKVGAESVGYLDVVALDDCGDIRWRAMEQRDWLRRIDAASWEECRSEARARASRSDASALSPHEQVLADAGSSDEILAGQIVEADPALVQAVADELQRRGLVGSAAAEPNPLAQMELPRGMEALSQMERAQGPQREMTRMERRLMKRILKNDDKAKAKRERAEDPGRAASKPQMETQLAEGEAR